MDDDSARSSKERRRTVLATVFLCCELVGGRGCSFAGFGDIQFQTLGEVRSERFAFSGTAVR
eukprot:scaffold5126_cov190-Amphora_coffeaeformis.AAC.2